LYIEFHDWGWDIAWRNGFIWNTGLSDQLPVGTLDIGSQVVVKAVGNC
jgi:hypothetical protein